MRTVDTLGGSFSELSKIADPVKPVSLARSHFVPDTIDRRDRRAQYSLV